MGSVYNIHFLTYTSLFLVLPGPITSFVNSEIFLLSVSIRLLPTTDPSLRFPNSPHHHKHPISQNPIKMEGRRGGNENPIDKSIKSNSHVRKMQFLVDKDPEGGWDECWEQGVTPWDLGKATPVILHLLQSEALPKGRVLVPGCGSGHDVIAIASSERYVVGLDLSSNAIKIARELPVSSPNANNFEFIEADFFSWHPTELFDLIFDYTFFCAIEPQKRSFWARRVHELLKPDGELMTLMFPIGDHVGGPPYKVSVIDYEEVLHPLGFKAISITDNELAIESRKGKEKLGRWKRCLNHSLL